MILFFGTRPGKEEQKNLEGVACPHCGQRQSLTLLKRSSWFHLFWIKLFRIGTQMLAECSHCKRVFFKEEFNEEMMAVAENF